VAEIGVASGDNAFDMLFNYPLEYMLLVDSYIPYRDNANHGIINLEQQNNNFMNVLSKFIPRQLFGKVIFSCMPSEKIVKYYPDNFFDYVYIDANHEYENVKPDIELWFPKVKNKCFLAGHDYEGYYPDVTRAVNEFKDNHKDTIEFIKCSEYDWLFYKK
jgi:hypothetical protein